MGVTVGCDRRHFGKGVGLHYLSDNELVSWDELGWVTGVFALHITGGALVIARVIAMA